MQSGEQARTERRLAVILAADIKDSSPLMRRDEARTLAQKNEIRADLVDPTIVRYGGRIANTAGDSLLIEFRDVVDALLCAIEVQGNMGTRNAVFPVESRIQFRVAIHVGHVNVDLRGDMHGNDVNIAFRLEEKAEPGGIWVSSRVQEIALGRCAVDFEDVGEQELKGIGAVRAYRVRPPRAVPVGGLPTEFLFNYEKDIIRAYIEGKGRFPEDKVSKGCPPIWPQVRTVEAATDNPMEPRIAGAWRDAAQVRVDARLLAEADPSISERMVFPEAGPRKHVISQDPLRAAILVSGGLAPGINAAIEGIVERHRQYASAFLKRNPHYRLELEGYQEGFKALTGTANLPRLKDMANVKTQAMLGGSLLPTARADELLDRDPFIRRNRLIQAARKLHDDRVKILYVIGGDGSMRAAFAIANTYRETYPDPDEKLIVVGVPKTMDNDILWVWQSFGFLSAVERAREFITHLHTEVTSNPRLCVVQLFGSDSGFVASHAALGSGICDLVLIPEMQFTIEQVYHHVRNRLEDRAKGSSVPYGIIVMAETALPIDADRYLDAEEYEHIGLSKGEKTAIERFISNQRRVSGQTPDDLRSATLKIISRELQRRIRALGGRYWPEFRVFVNEPRHLIRSLPPNAIEAIFAKRLGTLAVDSAMAGYTDVIISQWLTEFVLVPLELAVLGRKRVPLGGMFWKAVEAATGQEPQIRE
jgi:6-phosphofructokinase 1